MSDWISTSTRLTLPDGRYMVEVRGDQFRVQHLSEYMEEYTRTKETPERRAMREELARQRRVDGPITG